MLASRTASLCSSRARWAPCSWCAGRGHEKVATRTRALVGGADTLAWSQIGIEGSERYSPERLSLTGSLGLDRIARSVCCALVGVRFPVAATDRSLFVGTALGFGFANPRAVRIAAQHVLWEVA